MDRIGTLEKLPPGQVEVPETMVDVLVEADADGGRTTETFASAATGGGSGGGGGGRITSVSRLALF